MCGEMLTLNRKDLVEASQLILSVSVKSGEKSRNKCTIHTSSWHNTSEWEDMRHWPGRDNLRCSPLDTECTGQRRYESQNVCTSRT